MSAEKERKFRINIHLPEELNEISQLFQETVNRKSLMGQFLVNLLIYFKDLLGRERMEILIREVARGNTGELKNLLNGSTDRKEQLREDSAEEIEIENFFL